MKIINIKRSIACAFVVMIICSICSIISYAATIEEQTNIITIDTGDSEIGVEIYESYNGITRSYNTTSLSHSGRFYLKSDNSTLARFKVTGTFAYDGTLCNVTDCTTSIWEVEDGWEVDDVTSEEQVSPTLAKAVGEFYLYYEATNTLSSSATITISCTHTGTTNAEFNGDE